KRHRTTNSIRASPGKGRTRTIRSASARTARTLGHPGGLVGHGGDPGYRDPCIIDKAAAFCRLQRFEFKTQHGSE
ncbi:MAG TPA: hypothetical protein PKC78_13695, partial [Accumulibacter sp.]|uniref:hypothetical protein n=1 Tax=Accumulibacter sp. TaxID=2053492 RepID=UPI002B8BC8B9